jgi:PPOX class probable F420-dependent enzyme
MENKMGLEIFQNEQYMNIETFRKSGEGVRTPVWFVEHNGELCFTTEAGSAKVKRLRRNPNARVAPCNVRGDPKGEWQPCTGRFLDNAEQKPVIKLYDRKYGLMKKFFDLMGRSRKQERVFIALKLTEPKNE